MARSSAKTVADYLAELPADRRAAIASVRDLVNAHLPDGYVETMNWGMISWEIPLVRYPDTYNRQPLAYVALAAQKNACSLYLMGACADEGQKRRLEPAAADMGGKLDMGKSCLRFRRVGELPLQAIGELIAGLPVDAYIALYAASRRR